MVIVLTKFKTLIINLTYLIMKILKQILLSVAGLVVAFVVMPSAVQAANVTLSFSTGSGTPYVLTVADTIEYVTVTNRNIIEIPSNINELTNLVQLNVSGNPDLISVPKEIGDLITMTDLYLTNNGLVSVPKEIGNLSNLKTLALYGNNLTGIPVEIGNLINLEILYMANNPLTSVPEEIGDLSKLERIYFYETNIIKLPFAFENLSSISYLNEFGKLDWGVRGAQESPVEFFTRIGWSMGDSSSSSSSVSSIISSSSSSVSSITSSSSSSSSVEQNTIYIEDQLVDPNTISVLPVVMNSDVSVSGFNLVLRYDYGFIVNDIVPNSLFNYFDFENDEDQGLITVTSNNMGDFDALMVGNQELFSIEFEVVDTETQPYYVTFEDAIISGAYDYEDTQIPNITDEFSFENGVVTLTSVIDLDVVADFDENGSFDMQDVVRAYLNLAGIPGNNLAAGTNLDVVTGSDYENYLGDPTAELVLNSDSIVNMYDVVALFSVASNQ